MSPSCSNSRSCERAPYSRESSYDSQASSHSNPQTIHSRRTMSRTNSKSRTSPPPPPALNGFSDFFHSRVSTPIPIPATKESDTECWERMLALQREYHCYNSARLEAAVEALERGCAIEEVPMREYPPFFTYTNRRDLIDASFEIMPGSSQWRIEDSTWDASGGNALLDASLFSCCRCLCDCVWWKSWSTVYIYLSPKRWEQIA